MKPVLKEALRDLGIDRIETNIDRFREFVFDLARNAGVSGSDPSWGAFDSSIPSAPGEPISDTVLIIDIGGSSTKVASRCLGKDGDVSWQVLFEHPNAYFKEHSSSGNSIERFCAALGSELEKASSQIKDLDRVQLGISWSFAVTNQVTANGSVTGIVTERESYRKTDWFLEDLENGFDVGQTFSSLLEQQLGVSVSKYVVGNDVVFTMKACPAAHGAMVISTGMNGTLVLSHDDGRGDTVCNSEMGQRTIVPNEWRSAGDLLSAKTPAETAEFLVSGRYLPKIFTSHLFKLKEAGLDQLDALVSAVVSSPDPYRVFQARDVGWLVSEPNRVVDAHPDLPLKDAEVVELLSGLAKALILRGSLIGSTLAAATIARQFEAGGSFVIALDSRLAREIPLFWSSLQANLGQHLPKGVTARFELLSPVDCPEGEVSVPIQGAANSLDSLAAI